MLHGGAAEMQQGMVAQFERAFPRGLKPRFFLLGALYGLNRLRKNGEEGANLSRNFPQGLKARLILLPLRHD